MNEDILITVKAYPNPSKKYQETVCIAGIVPNKGWIRIYPVPFRQMPYQQRFRKYEIINVNVRKSKNDPRPESYNPDIDSIRAKGFLDTGNRWQKRKEIILKFADESMCAIQRRQKETGKSLGMFQPREIIDLEIENVDAKRSAKKLDIYSQLSMFDGAVQRLEEIPFSFRYRYTCHEKSCKAHAQIIIDWEIFQLYRNLKEQCGDDEEEIKRKVRMKFLEELFSRAKDSYFYTGNMHLHPDSFILLGVFWPPK